MSGAVNAGIKEARLLTPDELRSVATRKKPSDRPVVGEHGVSMSEDALAQQFAEEHCHEFRWTPGMDWMENRGDHWARDDMLRRFDVARQLCRCLAVESEDGKEAMRLSSAKTRAAVINLAESDERIALAARAWDADRFALNTPDAVWNLQSGKCRERRARSWRCLTSPACRGPITTPTSTTWRD